MTRPQQCTIGAECGARMPIGTDTFRRSQRLIFSTICDECLEDEGEDMQIEIRIALRIPRSYH